MAKKKQEQTTNSETDFLSIYKQLKKGTMDPAQKKYISTGHASVDALLSDGRGLPLGVYIELSSKSGCGKCVTGESIVCVNNKLTKIEDVIKDIGFSQPDAPNDKVYSRNGYELFSHKYKEHVGNIITISDVHGNRISCTPIHPLLVVREDNKEEWVKASDIKLKDKIVMASYSNKCITGDEKVAYTEIFKKCIKHKQKKILYSYLEGFDLMKRKSNWKYGFMIDVSNSEIEFLSKELDNYGLIKSDGYDEYEYTERSVGQYKTYAHKKEGKEDKIYLRVDLNCDDFDQFVNPLILLDKQDKKQFYRPMDVEEFFAKIAGILDASGNVCINSKEISNRKITLFLNSKDDASCLQRMLAMFGIVGHLSVVNNYKYDYCLNLTTNSSLALAEMIEPFIIVKKNVINELIVSLKDADILPTKTNYLIASEICSEARDCFVYDFTIPTTHEFLVNGIVSHNTTMVLDIVKHICQQGYRVLYIDSETGLSDNLISKMGLKDYYDDLFIVVSTTTFNKTGALLDTAVKDPSIALIVIDSVTALTPDELVEDGKKISDGQVGIQARYTGNLLKRYRERINNNEKTMIFINQMRTKIPMGYGNAYDAPAGGNAQQFTMDIRLMMKSLESIKNDEGHQIGAVNNIWAIKNRCGEAFKDYQIKLLFGKGVDEIVEYSQWLIDNGIVDKKAAGNFTVMWNGEEIKIKGQLNFESWVSHNFDEIKSFVEEHGGLIPKSVDDLSDDLNDDEDFQESTDF